jgi:hypothetical protein
MKVPKKVILPLKNELSYWEAANSGKEMRPKNREKYSL